MNFTRAFYSFLLLICVAGLGLADKGRNSAIANAGTDQVRQDVLNWVSMFFFDPNLVDPVERHGAAVLPVVTTLLSKEGKLETGKINGALGLLKQVDKPYPPAVPVVVPHLRAEQWQRRESALGALAAIGSERNVPVFITMLYDPRDSVRWQAAMAIGKFGESPSLTALQIWREQAAAADESRSPAEKWLDGTMRNKIDKAADLIRQRVKVDNAKGRKGDGKKR